MNKTALQQAIEIGKTLEQPGDPGEIVGAYMTGYNQALKDFIEVISPMVDTTERQQLEDAYKNGYRLITQDNYPDSMYFNDYYLTKYPTT